MEEGRILDGCDESSPVETDSDPEAESMNFSATGSHTNNRLLNTIKFLDTLNENVDSSTVDMITLLSYVSEGRSSAVLTSCTGSALDSLPSALHLSQARSENSHDCSAPVSSLHSLDSSEEVRNEVRAEPMESLDTLASGAAQQPLDPSSTASSGIPEELSQTKQNKLEKRPKPAQTSSSSDCSNVGASSSLMTDASTLGNGLQALTLSGSDQLQKSPASKPKRKKKKKTKTTSDLNSCSVLPDNSLRASEGMLASSSTDMAVNPQPSSPLVQSGERKTGRKDAEAGIAEMASKQGRPKQQIHSQPPQQQFQQKCQPQLLSHQQQFQQQRQFQQQFQQRQPQQQLQQQPRQSNQQPRSEGAGRKQNTPGSTDKKRVHSSRFETYWTREEVSAGLKRGTLIEGKIRINPKNYEDAYVPLPDGSADVYIPGMACRNRTLNGDIKCIVCNQDGSADVYIPGMACRNRALNGDIVAVLLQDKENWRVFPDELDYFEEQSRSQVADDVDGNSKKPDREVKSEDGADVVVEDEEIVELDSTGNPIRITKVPVIDPNPTQVISQGTVTPKQTPQPKQGSTGKSNQRYKSVKEVLREGSPIARRLFTEETGEGPSSVNLDRFLQRTGKIVAILEMKHSRACGGSLKLQSDKNSNYALFSPFDSRIPRIMIPMNEVPPGFRERPEDFANVLYIARITEWSENSKMPRGTLARSLGEAGQIEPETESLLVLNDVDWSEFSKEVLACLPQQFPWTIPTCELEWRRDFRSECVFTIDPSTARDLDDALSCRSLGDDLYEVGVHIADVSYFVTEGTELDKVAKNRATSVYLVQKVIPMLPRLLCEELCSLNPDEDRLTFSVVWTMTETGEILDEWFGRSVIRSCVKLSYDHAQGFIEQPEREWTREELPPISEGFTVEDIKSRVLVMNKMAIAMRKSRCESGALRLDQVKIQFTLDQETGSPNGYFVYQQRESNKLVEEFMLLANMAVAHKIKSAFQDKALLRRHPPPQTRMIDDLKETCASLGFPLEVSSAKDIQHSLERYSGEDELSRARLQVLVALCSKPMQNAKYFCCGMIPDEKLYHHYALNVPLYTHFTSPIRRYPDIMVHRTLAAALEYSEVTKWSSATIQQIAEHCNDKKMNAKRSSEMSNEIFFSIFVKEAGPLEEKGMVMAVLDKSFDVYMLKFGVIKRVYCEKLPLDSFHPCKIGKRQELTMVWKPDNDCPQQITQKISIFTSVQCILKPEAEPLKWSALIRRPLSGDPSVIQ